MESPSEVDEKQSYLRRILRKRSRSIAEERARVLAHTQNFTGGWVLAVILLLGSVGTFAAGFLTYRHILLVSETGVVGGSALCRSSGLINCDAILLTEYAVLFGHISSAALGLMGFVFVLWCALNGLINRRLRKLAWIYLILYFFAAIGFSWYFLYLMAFTVDFVCPWCIVVHVVNIASLVLLLAASVRRRKEFLLPETSTWGERVYFTVGGILASLVVFFVAGMMEKSLSFMDARTKYEDLRNNPLVALALLEASPTYDIPIRENDPIFGSPRAVFPIIVFTDFACPVCAEREQFLRGLVMHNQRYLRIVYKSYPLSNKCNDFLIGNLHPNACPAARAAYAAYILGGNRAFQIYTHKLFLNMSKLSEGPYVELARELQLDVEKFQGLMRDGSAADKKVKQDIAEGVRLQLSATPQIFFLNKKIPEDFRGAYFVHILEDMIRRYRPETGDVKLTLPR